MHCRGASEHACPRYIARRRLDFAENSTAGIVGIPRVGASTDHSNYASALCCKRELLTRCSSPAISARCRISDGIAFVHSLKALRFSSTRNAAYRLSYSIKRRVQRFAGYIARNIAHNISSEFRARKLLSLRKSPSHKSRFRAQIFGHGLALRFGSVNEFGVYSNF